MSDIFQAQLAIIGGSGTLSLDFPRDLDRRDVQIIKENIVFDTPYGKSPPFTWFNLDEKSIITCKMHGWRIGVSRADASRQIFWVFREAGVKKVLAEGGVGSINHLLDIRDIVIASDYIDQTMRKDAGLEGHYLLVMRQAICPELRAKLIRAAETSSSETNNFKTDNLGRIFPRGIYVATDGRHFESPAEIAMFKGHGDIVGQSICPEVYLAREIGACYAGLYTVVNYGEGVVKDWEHADLESIFYQEAGKIANILLNAAKTIDIGQACGCDKLRKPTLLKEVYRR